eukprot:gene18236-23908_t
MGNAPSIIASMSKEELIYEFASLYHQNPELWDKIIENAQSKLPNSINNDVNDYAEDETDVITSNEPRDPNVIPFSNEIADEINLLRSDPVAYADNVVMKRYEKFVDDYIYKLPTGENLKTKEGRKLVKETADYLRTLKPITSITASIYLENASLDHGSDISFNNIFSHTGSNGASLRDRVERYGQWRGSLGENMDFGTNKPSDIITNLLIDDGVSTRGHRKNLLNPDYKFVGHDQIMKHDIKKTIKTINDLSNEDVKKILLSIPYNGDLYTEFYQEIEQGHQIIVDFSYTNKSVKLSFIQDKKTLTKSMSWGS